jgi:sugar lactone lactonase YvrE
MYSPGAVAVDANGTLWVSDAINNRLLRFNNAAAKANGASADGILGNPIFTTTIDFVTARYSVSRPQGLAIDATGTLWVADTLNNRVLRFDNANAKPNGALADGVLGQPAFDTSIPYSPPTASTLGNPWGVAVDAAGTLWVADSGNSRVLRYDNASAKANNGAADIVLGQKDFSGRLTATTRKGMDHPNAIAIAANGDLFVVESQNSRGTRFTPKADPVVPSTPTPAAAPPKLTLAGKKNIRTSKPGLVIKGSAASTEGIALIEYRAGKGGFHTASGTTSWHFKIALKPGKNTILIRAVSAGQQTSQLVLHVTRD